MNLVAHTRPPAKLNLFLELLKRRDDGFHEIDTVMIPIDWCDELQITRTEEAGVRLSVDWLPSQEVIAKRLGIDPKSDQGKQLLRVPSDESNLVHRAITRFVQTFEIQAGFDCRLGKRIPAGAGMGGASSDAAAALRCCAKLCGIPDHAQQLWDIAAEIGSDVPFFLGSVKNEKVLSMAAVRATGRGEVLCPAAVTSPLHFVVAYPNVALSTAKVYADCQVPLAPVSADEFVKELASGDISRFGPLMMNRLSEPAKKNAIEIDKMLRSLWRTDLRLCQLTGSGSACFALADSLEQANECSKRVLAMLEPGALVMATQSVGVPADVTVSSELHSST
ncbi:MAG: 4-(cytidine 5'-diphospho)-2-C-methyl-D-erythritol kinase [Rubripirellula sp.]